MAGEQTVPNVEILTGTSGSGSINSSDAYGYRPGISSTPPRAEGDAVWAAGSFGIGSPNDFTRWMDSWDPVQKNIDQSLQAAETALSVAEGVFTGALSPAVLALKQSLEAILKFLDSLDLKASYTILDVPFNLGDWYLTPKDPTKVADFAQVKFQIDNFWDLSGLAESTASGLNAAANATALGALVQSGAQYPGGPRGLKDLLIASLNSGADSTPYISEKATVAGISLVASAETVTDLDAARKFFLALARIISGARSDVQAGIAAAKAAWAQGSFNTDGLPGALGDSTFYYSKNAVRISVKDVRRKGDTWTAPTAGYKIQYTASPTHFATYVNKDLTAPTPPAAGDLARNGWIPVTGTSQDPYVTGLEWDGKTATYVLPIENILAAKGYESFGAVGGAGAPLLKLQVATVFRYDPAAVAYVVEGTTHTHTAAPTTAPATTTVYAVPGAGKPRSNSAALSWSVASVAGNTSGQAPPLAEGVRKVVEAAGKKWLDPLEKTINVAVKEAFKSARNAIAATREALKRLTELIEALKELGSLRVNCFARAFLYTGAPSFELSSYLQFGPGTADTSTPYATGKAALIQEYTNSLGALPQRNPNEPAIGLFILLDTIAMPDDVVRAVLETWCKLLGIPVQSGGSDVVTDVQRYADVLEGALAGVAGAEAPTLPPAIFGGAQQPVTSTAPVGTEEEDAQAAGLFLDWNCPPPINPTGAGSVTDFGPDLKPLRKSRDGRPVNGVADV